MAQDHEAFVKAVQDINKASKQGGGKVLKSLRLAELVRDQLDEPDRMHYQMMAKRLNEGQNIFYSADEAKRHHAWSERVDALVESTSLKLGAQRSLARKG